MAIARAILRDAPILILDAVAASMVIDALERASSGRTTFMIAHRLSTVRFANRILVFDKGRIVEHGTHDQLLARNGRYARLYHLQTATRPETPPELRLIG